MVDNQYLKRLYAEGALQLRMANLNKAHNLEHETHLAKAATK